MILAIELMVWLLFVGTAALLLWGKTYFLAPYRVGWLMLLANAVGEAIEIRLKIARPMQDVALWLFSTITLALVGGAWVAGLYALISGLVLLIAMQTEMRWLADIPANQFSETAGRVPLPIPRLIVSLRGPVFERNSKSYLIGDLPQGLSQKFELFVLNPGMVRPQLPMKIEVVSNSQSLEVDLEDLGSECPEPGRVVRQVFEVRAVRAGNGGEVSVSVRHGDFLWSRRLRISSVVETSQAKARSVAIQRWKYGCNAGFNWRGDNDLYDPSTFQSAEGLRIALGLAARYRMPTTVMLSPRLSFEEEEHRAFCQRFGWNRHSEEIPQFIEFFRNEVDLENEQDFPTRCEKPYAAEIGNHMYLHYGTHAAADPGNGWMSHAKMGDGNYSWLQKYPCTSLEEQRDNILKCSESIKQHIGVETTCFTIPSDCYDDHTSQAVEAAGIEVGNDTDTNKIQKLLLFPKERHPKGCETLAEITRMIPKDVVNAPQVAMLKFWVGFARRNRRALVYLAHHHLVMYQTNACYNLTSELLRHVLADTEGDVYCATITSLGRYWRDVLSERTKKVRIELNENRVTVFNDGSSDLNGIPVEFSMIRGGRWMQLVDLPANQSVVIDWNGH